MTGKVSQICRREDLNRVSGKVIISILEMFEYGHVGIPVIVENVPEERCQLMNLDGRWSNVHVGNDGISVFHAGFLHRSRAFWSCINMGMPISIWGDLRNLEIATPVVGELGGAERELKYRVPWILRYPEGWILFVASLVVGQWWMIPFAWSGLEPESCSGKLHVQMECWPDGLDLDLDPT